MPTGYTYNVAEGKINKLSEYMAEAIYAMGVMVMYRDVPRDRRPVLNEHTEVSHFDLGESDIVRLQKKIADLIDQANHLIAMDETQTHAAYIAHLKKENRIDAEREANASANHINYNHMIKRVEAWTPSAISLDNLKSFMLQQLYTSVENDLRPDQVNAYRTAFPTDPEVWRAEQLRSLRNDLKYYVDELDGTKDRVRARAEMLHAFLIDFKLQLQLEKQNP